MCDYSLMAVPNRLAQEGDELLTYRFPTGSLGMASSMDVKRATIAPVCASKSLWTLLTGLFASPRREPVCAVCIPPDRKSTRLNSSH